MKNTQGKASNQDYGYRENTDHTKKNARKMTAKRLVALIGVALLIILYVATLIVAIVDTSASGKWFRICLVATVAVPLLIWIYTWMYGILTGRHTIADISSGTKYDRDSKADTDTTDETPPDR